MRESVPVSGCRHHEGVRGSAFHGKTVRWPTPKRCFRHDRARGRRKYAFLYARVVPLGVGSPRLSVEGGTPLRRACERKENDGGAVGRARDREVVARRGLGRGNDGPLLLPDCGEERPDCEPRSALPTSLSRRRIVSQAAVVEDFFDDTLLRPWRRKRLLRKG